MVTIGFLALLLLISVVLANLAVDKADKVPVMTVLLLFGSICFAVLYSVNEVYPFAEGGDDKRYYEQSLRKLGSFTEWFDFGQINRYQEQGGYGMLLTWTGQLVGESLYLRKCVNVAWFLILSIVWYSIGHMTGGRKLALTMFSGTLLCTPLWYFWLFLLKDMTIVLLQSAALFGVISFFTKGRKLRGVAVLIISTILTIPFRMYLVMVNMAVLGVATLLLGRDKKAASSIINVVLVGAFIVGGILLGTNRTMLESLGAKGTQRTLSAESISGNLDDLDAAKEYQLRSDRLYVFKYPVLFLVGETSGLNPNIWGYRSATRIRGVVAIPWIFFGIPLFVSGVVRIFKKPRTKLLSEIGDSEILRQRSILLVLMAFIGVYAVFAWISTDTTRWRMPVMPAMMAIVAWAWAGMSGGRRIMVMSGWLVALVILSSGYYLFRTIF